MTKNISLSIIIRLLTGLVFGGYIGFKIWLMSNAEHPAAPWLFTIAGCLLFSILVLLLPLKIRRKPK